MAKVGNKGQLSSYLTRLFPPSSPRVAQPSELIETLNLVVPALPPSLVYERSGIQFGNTVNPATQLFFPSSSGDVPGATEAGVPAGKLYLIHAARWSQITANVTVTGRAWIALKNNGGTDELAMAVGLFSAADAAFAGTFLDLRAPHIGAGGTNNGGGNGPFVVPPGWSVHFSTAATPAAATLFRAVVHYTVVDIGELLPAFSAG